MAWCGTECIVSPKAECLRGLKIDVSDLLRTYFVLYLFFTLEFVIGRSAQARANHCYTAAGRDLDGSISLLRLAPDLLPDLRRMQKRALGAPSSLSLYWYEYFRNARIRSKFQSLKEREPMLGRDSRVRRVSCFKTSSPHLSFSFVLSLPPHVRASSFPCVRSSVLSLPDIRRRCRVIIAEGLRIMRRAVCLPAQSDSFATPSSSLPTRPLNGSTCYYLRRMS